MSHAHRNAAAAGAASHSPHPPVADAGDAVDYVVGVSGGVDSAVALMRLRDAGHRVRAVFMKNWEEDDTDGYCAAAEDLDDARRVCERLGVPLSTVNFSYEYWESVFTGFLDEMRRGRTPNPDVMCNQELKFRAFLDYALDLGGSAIATGHYARVQIGEDGAHLLRARDENKDQTYFLHRLDQSQLARACFPLGSLDKPEVRRLARDAGLEVHAKKDSTGLCFIGERPFAGFLERYLAPAPGNMESVEGEVLGQHRGLAFYTLGQRQGLGLGGRRGSSGEPWYVAGKDLARNVLTVAQGRLHPALWCRRLSADSAHWIAGAPPTRDFACRARLRHRQPLQDCRVHVVRDAVIDVAFTEPQFAATPGQSVVFYRDDECLGGAIVDAAGSGGAPAR